MADATPSFEVPPEALELARSLGEPVAEHGPTLAYRVMARLGIGLALLLGGIILAAGLVGALRNVGCGAYLFLVGGSAVLVLGARLFRKARRELRTRVLRFSGGLLHLGPGTARAFPWDDIEAFWESAVDERYHGVTINTLYKHTVRRADGKRATFDQELCDVAGIGEAIRVEAGTRLLTKVRTQLEQRGRVDFGPLAVSRDGLHQGAELLPWADVKDITASGGVLAVTERGKWLSWLKVATAAVPNLWVLLTLVQEQTEGIRRT